MHNFLKASLPFMCVVNLLLADESTIFIDYQFNDNAGYSSKFATNDGILGVESDVRWTNGGFGKTDGNGKLNYGYTGDYPWRYTDKGTNPTQANRRLGRYSVDYVSLDEDLVSKDDTNYYEFIVEFAGWDLSGEQHDNDNDVYDGVVGKGIYIYLNSDNLSARIGLETDGKGNVGTTTSSNNNGEAQRTFMEIEDQDVTLKIEGNLSNGSWTSYVGTGSDVTNWIQFGSGGDITEISTILVSSRSPGKYSWGGDADNANNIGDFMVIDSMSLTGYAAVPEPSSYVLIAGMFALASIVVRRRM